jgi:hypothetical protein
MDWLHRELKEKGEKAMDWTHVIQNAEKVHG